MSRIMLAFLLVLMPSPVHVFVRRLLGARIAKGSRIRWGTLVLAPSIEVGRGVSIGPFCVVRAESLKIGDHSHIKPLCLLSCSRIELGCYTHIAPTAVIHASFGPRSRFKLGDHSRIFPFCWIEPGEGVEIGNQVGIGGHGLIFTHGAWPNFLKGGPVSYGPVVIEDNVWLPWRVFVLPNVTIGKNSIIGGGSIVNKSIPEASLAAGAPAKVIGDKLATSLSLEERHSRATRILTEYAEQLAYSNGDGRCELRGNRLEFGRVISIDEDQDLGAGDLLFLVGRELGTSERDLLLMRGVSVLDVAADTIDLAASEPYLRDFIGHLRRYGVRLYVRSAADRGAELVRRGIPVVSIRKEPV